MFTGVERVLEAYPKIYLACHTRHVRDDVSGRKLSPRLASLLDHLGSERALSISELARHLDLTESTVSLQVTKLERFGYVKRVPDRDDSRRVRVELTRSGRQVRANNSVLDTELVAKMLRLMSESEIQAAVSGLETLARAAVKLMARRQPRRRRQSA